VKNKTEIAGMREAHARDCGAAVFLSLRLLIKCDLFGWLEDQVYSDGMVKESDVPLQLTEYQKFLLLRNSLTIDSEIIT